MQWQIQTFGKRAHHVVDPDIRLGGQFNVSQYLTFISSSEGFKVYSQTGWGHGQIFPHPGSAIEDMLQVLGLFPDFQMYLPLSFILAESDPNLSSNCHCKFQTFYPTDDKWTPFQLAI